MQELKANPQRSAKGIVIEAGLDKSKGPVATFIVQNGTLKKGDVLVCGEAFGEVGIWLKKLLLTMVLAEIQLNYG